MSDAHDLTLLLAQHHRLDAPGGKCSCGHETALGDFVSRHIADEIIGAGWTSKRTVYQTGKDRQVEAERRAEHFRALAARLRVERDALAATVERVTALVELPDPNRQPTYQPYAVDLSDGVHMAVLVDDLRDALAAEPSP